MDRGTRFRLERELKRNEKRIEECMTEAELLEDRNENIKRKLAKDAE